MNSPYKTATFWALLGPASCYTALAVNYWITEGPFPGYEIICYPGIVATRIVSEETLYLVKLALMFIGQYSFWWFAICTGIWLRQKLVVNIDT